jgi:hypothetical protein
MDCVNCGSNNSNTFFTETIPCSHCNEINDIAYHACQTCGLIWKSIGDKILEGVIFTEPELGQLLSDSIDKMSSLMDKPYKNSMREIIHKCLRCNTTSFEVRPNLYHCPDCGFEWEVI